MTDQTTIGALLDAKDELQALIDDSAQGTTEADRRTVADMRAMMRDIDSQIEAATGDKVMRLDMFGQLHDTGRTEAELNGFNATQGRMF